MIITIDTTRDSKEDIKKAIKFLTEYIGTQESGVMNMFAPQQTDSPTESTAESATDSPTESTAETTSENNPDESDILKLFEDDKNEKNPTIVPY